MKVIINIKAIVAEDTQLEDLMIVKSNLMTIDAGYTDLKLESPDWVTDKLDEVVREIHGRVRAELTRRLKAAKSRHSALKSRDERRKDTEAEIAELEAKLV